MNYKVSVIVPIYKVEQYLQRCVDSIINQTYKNLEIILVDDGSPDNCGKICNDYAKKDSRIKSIHKANGGLSDARNYGMKYATGDFVLFIDSDDWIKVEMIEVMINKAKEYNADVVQSAFYYAYEDYMLFDDRYYKENQNPIVLNREELIRELVINERVKNFAWGKLYKINLIKDIPFEKGVLFEDVFWAHKVMHRVNTYVILNNPMCYYLQRRDSIVGNYTPRNLDIIRGLKERHKFISEYYSYLVKESYTLILKTSFQHYYLLTRNKDKDPNNLFREEIKKYIYANYEDILKSVEKDKGLTMKLRLFKIHPNLIFLNDIIDKILRKIRIKKSPKGLKKIYLKERIS